MKKILLLILFVFIPIHVFAFELPDTQVWNSLSASRKAGKYWRASLKQEIRFGDGEGLYYTHTDIFFNNNYFAKKMSENRFFLFNEENRILGAHWFYWGIGYRHVFEDKEDSWKSEKRPYIDFDYRWRFHRFLNKFHFSNRVRFEYRSREDLADYWRFRNKLKVIFPWKFSKLKAQPYIADEIFYDGISNKGFNFSEDYQSRNRFFAGCTMKIKEGLNGEVYYMLQSTKQDEGFDDANILGLELKFVF